MVSTFIAPRMLLISTMSKSSIYNSIKDDTFMLFFFREGDKNDTKFSYSQIITLTILDNSECFLSTVQIFVHP